MCPKKNRKQFDYDLKYYSHNNLVLKLEEEINLNLIR